MGKSKIDWTEYTWNPVVGCSHASPGCAHCYAETMARRLAAMGQKNYQAVTAYSPEGFLNDKEPYLSVGGWNGGVNFSESALKKPYHWKQPRRIFVSSMGDPFHENVPFEWIDRVMSEIAMNPRHIFMILTKRAERMLEYFNSINRFDNFYEWFCEKIIPYGSNYKEIESLPVEWPLPNLWLGVTAENQKMADLRIPILLQIPAALRFVSIEPMLGPVEILNYHPFKPGDKKYGWENQCSIKSNDGMRQCGGHKEDHLAGLDWVILGMETGPGARTFLGAAKAIVSAKDQCVVTGVPFFYKGPYGVDSYCESRTDREKKYFLYRCDKGEARLIEGAEYRQFPEEK